jgi:hypothetical protein
MMKKIIYLGFTLICLSSCTITYPGIATGNVSEKTGVSERTVWFGIAIKPIDVSIETAAKKGKISKVATVDYQVRNGIFRVTYKTIVTGN